MWEKVSLMTTFFALGSHMRTDFLSIHVHGRAGPGPGGGGIFIEIEF